VLQFTARVGDRSLDGLDVITTDDEGRITELMVLIRPMSGARALAEAMQRRLPA
jgi:hypothetical protein